MSFQDSAVIFFIALLLFGPKKLPELARQLGKLMGEFRRASNEFRMQMEDELRISEQAEAQKKIAALEAAAPTTAATETPADSATPAQIYEELPAHPHEALSQPVSSHAEGGSHAENDSHAEGSYTHADGSYTHAEGSYESAEATLPAAELPDLPEHSIAAASAQAAVSEPVAIATSGELSMMPPASGLPVGRTNSGVAQAFESIPQQPDLQPDRQPATENANHG